MHTIRTYTYNGPSFGASKGKYQAASLKDVLFHCRLAMEDNEDLIGLFDANGACKGFWEAEAEAESDGEGGWCFPAVSYVLRRPGAVTAPAKARFDRLSAFLK